MQCVSSVRGLYAGSQAENDSRGRQTRVESSGRVSRNAATIEAVAAYLEGKTTPVITSSIVAILATKGIEIEAKDQRNALGAMMSHSGRFESYGRKGWLLKSPSGPKNTEAADDPDKEQTSAASNEPRLTAEGTQGWPQARPQAAHEDSWRGGGT